MPYKDVEKEKEFRKRQYAAHKELFIWRATASQNMKRYGVSVEDWDRMYLEQDGCCKICNTHQSELARRLSIDHCHTTGKVRGLLCMRCNAGLGNFKDDAELLLTAINYLKENA